MSPSAAKLTVAACKRLKFVQNVVLIEEKISDKFAISLSGLIKKYEKLNFNIEDHVCGEVDISDQTALIICSSGTTGLPKGVLITQENMMACLQTSRGGMELFKSLHNGSIVALNIGPWYGKKLSLHREIIYFHPIYKGFMFSALSRCLCLLASLMRLLFFCRSLMKLFSTSRLRCVTKNIKQLKITKKWFFRSLIKSVF